MPSIYQKYFPDLESIKLEKLEALKELYIEWNRKINVISRKEYDSFEVQHVLHSLSIAKAFEFKPGADVLDFGTGGGFPGIPLAIFFPETRFTLVDSIGKKIKVVQGVIDKLGLQNVIADNERVENLDQKFDFITCRAVGKIEKIMPWVNKSLKKKSLHDQPNGYIFLKGGDLQEEMKQSRMPYKRLKIADYFEEEFFQTKEIVYLSKHLKNKS